METLDKKELINSEKINQIAISESKDELDLLSMAIYNELLFAKGISDP
jgi:hypothetical protein